jgi:parallel beta-helix repeat protein
MKSLKTVFARAALPAVMLLGLAHEAKAQTPISACTTITQSGNYQLTADLPLTSGDCLVVQNASNVTIDGAGHHINVPGDVAGVHVKNSSSVTVENIQFDGYYTTSLSLFVEGSQNVNVLTSTFNNAGLYADSNSSTFIVQQNPSLTNSPILSSATPTYILNNTIKNNDGQNRASGIQIKGGSGHFIWNNHLDGGWNQTYPAPGQNFTGTDDGIILWDVSNAYIANNYIANVWDTGIESVGALSGTTITGNNISGAGYCGIGGWWGSGGGGDYTGSASFTGNTVSNNTVDHSPFLFAMGGSGTSFLNNSFSNNSLTAQTVVYPSDGAGLINFPSSGSLASNNTFTGNNFGVNGAGPYLVPESAIIDGGGNKCMGVPSSQPNPSSYPLHCSPPPSP